MLAEFSHSPSQLRVEVNSLSTVAANKLKPHEALIAEYATPAMARNMLKLENELTKIFGEGNVTFSLHGGRNTNISELITRLPRGEKHFSSYDITDVKSDAHTAWDCLTDFKRLVNHIGWAAGNVPSQDMWGLKTSEGLFRLKQNPILAIHANAGYWHDGSQLGVVTDRTINKMIWMVTLNQFAGKEEAHERLDRGDIDLFEATKIMGKAAKANAVSEHFHGGLEFHPGDYQWMGSPKGGLLYCRQKLVAGWEAGYGRQQGED